MSKEIRSVGKATLLGLVGITAVQINSFLDMLFARYADLKGPIYLWYAIRLEQLPLALIGFACVYSMVPSLSRAIKAGEKEKAQSLFSFGYQRILLLVIPCLFAVFALGFASVNLLFGRGQFSPNAVSQTTFCLWAYALGLLPSTLTLYQSSQFYAYGDFKTPTTASLISVAANVLLNALFVFCFHWGPISIALSTSLSSCLNYWILKQQFPKKDHLQLAIFANCSTIRIVFACSFALLLCLWIDWAFIKTSDLRAFSEQALHFCTQFLSFTMFFVCGMFLLDKKNLIAMKNFVRSEKVLDYTKSKK
jgi:putative peptidoglycan lipid II flippase